MSSSEEGIIQFRCLWTPSEPPQGSLVDELCRWRDRCRAAGIIGVQPDGIGYGNISVRIPGTDRFIISGTQTGHIDSLMPEHCARVSSFAIGENSVTCDGPVPASSETLSHAAIYSGCRDAGAVVHGHDHSAWIRHRGFASVPSVDAAAGTAELARQLAGCATSMECTSGFIVMRGHPDGLVAFGDSLGVAVLTMLAAVR